MYRSLGRAALGSLALCVCAYGVSKQRNMFNRILHIIIQMTASFNVPNGRNVTLLCDMSFVKRFNV